MAGERHGRGMETARYCELAFIVIQYFGRSALLLLLLLLVVLLLLHTISTVFVWSETQNCKCFDASKSGGFYVGFPSKFTRK